MKLRDFRASELLAAVSECASAPGLLLCAAGRTRWPEEKEGVGEASLLFGPNCGSCALHVLRGGLTPGPLLPYLLLLQLW